MRLSFCILTREASGRVAAIVELLRPVVDEIVIGVDDRADDEAVASLQAIADEVWLYPHRDPIDSATPWLHSLCSGEWILNVDHDEIPSASLVAALPALVAADDVTHYFLARRWLWPDAGSYLTDPPWGREAVPKLIRNDPVNLRFSDEFHRPIIVAGPGRFVDEPLWHADFLLRPWEFRRDKALEYERSRRGLRVAGVALNAGFYLPELRPGATVAQVPGAERRLIESVLGASPPVPPPPPWPSPARASRADLDWLWPGGWAHVGDLHRGRVELVEHVEHLGRLTAGVQQTIDVLVTNESDWPWGHGAEARPEVRLAYRWHDPPAGWSDPALRTALPAPLRPGQTELVPVHVVPPERPGRYTLELDLVHEHVQWFGGGVRLELDVAPRRRVALFGCGDALTEELDRLQLEPELEPAIVRGSETLSSPDRGHPLISDPGDALLVGLSGASRLRLALVLPLRTRALARRARQVRAARRGRTLGAAAESLLAELASCERLIVTSKDWKAGRPVTRELWRLVATVRVSAELGLPIEVRPGALDGFTRPLDLRLVAVIGRHSRVVAGKAVEPAR